MKFAKVVFWIAGIGRAGADSVVLFVRRYRAPGSTSNHPSPSSLRFCGSHDGVAVCILCDRDEPSSLPPDDDSFRDRKAGLRYDSRGAPSARTTEPGAADDQRRILCWVRYFLSRFT